MRNKKLTKNFKEKEFVESRFFGDFQKEVNKLYESNEEVRSNTKLLAEQLQVLRDELNKPVSINIGYRPLEWELKQGRSGKSQHVLGKAADIVVKGMQASDVANVISRLIRNGKMQDGGLGIYSSWVHYDIGGKGRRWRK